MSDLRAEVPDWLAAGLQRPVAVLGRGASGQAACSLLGKLDAEIVVYDEGAGGLAFDAKAAASHALLVCSPGFAADHEWLVRASEAGLLIVPELELGAAFWKGRLLAVTGTNGKTTLTEFLDSAFNSAGIEAYACGNIGRPLCSLVADGCNREAVAVCEVSSFQAEQMQHFCADSVLWTNFAEDHLDRHASMEDYFRSKFRLVAAMGEGVFLHDSSVQEFAESIGLDLGPAAQRVDHDVENCPGVGGTVFAVEPERNTYLMARALWSYLGLDEAELIEAAHGFQKSPHRMELIASEEGISYWDDSKSTNFHSVVGALRRFENPVTWIGGGKSKGGDMEAFVGRIADKIESAHLIGETADRIAAAFMERGVPARVYVNLEEAVAGARAAASAESNILLSPGFASLDMFEGYSQRGEAFRRAISQF